MNSSCKLTLIGYWHSYLEPEFPDPSWFIDESWDPSIRQLVIEYLNNGQKMPYAFMGYSWCRFRCGNTVPGTGELTDGKYLWPEGLSHYLKHHYVRLPQEIVDFITNGNKITFDPKIRQPEVDLQWWKNQKGWNKDVQSYKGLQDIGFLEIVQVDHTKSTAQERILLDLLNNSSRIKGKVKSIQDIINGKKTVVHGWFENLDHFLVDAISVGLSVKFTEALP